MRNNFSLGDIYIYIYVRSLLRDRSIHGSARMRGILSTTCVNQVTPGNLSVTNGIPKRDSRKFERD